jgi:hypothetical protein
MGERRRIARLAERDERYAQTVGAGEFGFGFGFGAEPDVVRSAARRDSAGSAAMAASAPPNSLTRARKVAGPTFSLRISRSQASR